MRGARSIPWSYSFTRNYQHVDDQEARQRVLAEAAADLKAQNEAKQPRADALMAKTQSLGQELGAAAQKRLCARQRDQQRAGEVGAEYQKLLEEGGTTAKLNAAAAAASHDLMMSIAVQVNPRGESPDEGAEALRLPPARTPRFAGARSAKACTRTTLSCCSRMAAVE